MSKLLRDVLRGEADKQEFNSSRILSGIGARKVHTKSRSKGIAQIAGAVCLGALAIAIVPVSLAMNGPRSAPEPSASPPPLLTYERNLDTSPAAVVNGTLHLEGSCLFIGDMVAVFPPRTVWDEKADQVVLGDGTRLSMGDAISFGGGVYAIRGALPPPLQQIASRLEECSAGAGEPPEAAMLSSIIL